eukprot:UN05006
MYVNHRQSGSNYNGYQAEYRVDSYGRRYGRSNGAMYEQEDPRRSTSRPIEVREEEEDEYHTPRHNGSRHTSNSNGNITFAPGTRGSSMHRRSYSRTSTKRSYSQFGTSDENSTSYSEDSLTHQNSLPRLAEDEVSRVSSTRSNTATNTTRGRKINFDPSKRKLIVYTQALVIPLVMYWPERMNSCVEIM